jgi:hypothetical protein
MPVTPAAPKTLASNTVARDIPVGIPVLFDALDDPETMDGIDAPPPRAIPVNPSHLRKPDIRPESDRAAVSCSAQRRRRSGMTRTS